MFIHYYCSIWTFATYNTITCPAGNQNKELLNKEISELKSLNPGIHLELKLYFEKFL